MNAMNSHPNTGTITETRLKGQWVWLGRSIWIILTAMTIVAFMYAAPIRIKTLATTCETDCQSIQISEVGLNRIQEAFGLSLTAYAIIIGSKEVLFGVICIIAGAVIFWRRPDDWLVIIISLSLIIMGPIAVFFIDNIYVQVLQGIGFSLLVNIFFVFPDGHFVPNWTRWMSVLSGIILLAAPFTPIFNTLIWYVAIVVFSTIGLFAQYYRYRHVATPIQRQQTKWVVYGFAIFFVGIIFLALPQAIFPTILNPINAPTVTVADFIWRAVIGFFLGFLFLYFLPIAIAISTLRYRLWDADPIINRSLVYGFMTLGVVIMLFVFTLLTQFIFGEQQPVVAIGIAGVISATTFNPARNRIQRWVDHNIYGFRYDLNALNAAQQLPEIRNPGALTGQVIDGYEVRGVIGKGGMGEVYRGFGNGQQVAIKTMLPDFAKDEAMRTRFEREATAGQSLKHQNIAQVFASGVFDETPYLIMEYVEGVDLSTRIKQDGALDVETTTTILQHVCAALDVAHEQGYVHRDIKPGNIMLRTNDEAVLMDFGITKLQDSTSALTGTGAIGTIDYMAPEQIMAAQEVDHRADIYALGVMLYEMLIGEKPYTGNAAQVMFAHIQQPPPDARKKDASISIDIADAIDRAMAKDPDDRYASAGEFASVLSV